MYKHQSIGDGFFGPLTDATVTDGTNALASQIFSGSLSPYIPASQLSAQDEVSFQQHWKLSPSFNVPNDTALVTLARLTTPREHMGDQEMAVLVEMAGSAFCSRGDYFQPVPIVCHADVIWTLPTGNWYPAEINEMFYPPYYAGRDGFSSVRSRFILRENLGVPLFVGWVFVNGTSVVRSFYAGQCSMSARFGTICVNTFERSY